MLLRIRIEARTTAEGIPDNVHGEVCSIEPDTYSPGSIERIHFAFVKIPDLTAADMALLLEPVYDMATTLPSGRHPVLANRKVTIDSTKLIAALTGANKKKVQDTFDPTISVPNADFPVLPRIVVMANTKVA